MPKSKKTTACFTKNRIWQRYQITKYWGNPVIDVYKFVGNNEQRLELVKLMADEGGAAKSLENELTSKNYPFINCLSLQLRK
jgi:hypothetical protein